MRTRWVEWFCCIEPFERFSPVWIDARSSGHVSVRWLRKGLLEVYCCLHRAFCLNPVWQLFWIWRNGVILCTENICTLFRARTLELWTLFPLVREPHKRAWDSNLATMSPLFWIPLLIYLQNLTGAPAFSYPRVFHYIVGYLCHLNCPQ